MTEGKIIQSVVEERGNYCENCFADGRRVKIDGHHAFFKSKYPELAKEKWNIVMLCHECHQEGKDAVHNGNDKLRRKCEQIALARKNGTYEENPLMI